uniref:Uncharacterized protein n=1 Tax=Rhizophora mucronata TaxID=61149 RepID=A0A2P2IJ36_RHIMU
MSSSKSSSKSVSVNNPSLVEATKRLVKPWLVGVDSESGSEAKSFSNKNLSSSRETSWSLNLLLSPSNDFPIKEEQSLVDTAASARIKPSPESVCNSFTVRFTTSGSSK